MSKKILALGAVVAVLAVASLVYAQAQAQSQTSKPDPRIDKLLEQNEQILKNQADILKSLEELKLGIRQVRRSGS